MTERVADGGVAGAVTFVRFALHVGATGTRPGQCGVGVSDVQHQAHRVDPRRGGLQSEVGEFVGEVQDTAAHREFGMADAAVVHHDRLTDQFRAEGVAVPVDGSAGIGHRQVGQGRGPGRFGDCADAHHKSFRRIGEGRHGLQSCSQPGRKGRIRLYGKVFGGQDPQWIGHETPPSG